MHVNVMLVVALLAVKRQEHQAEHVERRQQRRGQSEPIQCVPHGAAAIFILKSAQKDGVFAEEPRERRKPGNRQRGRQHGHVRPANLFAEPTHVVHVLLAAHGMNHAAGRKEKERLEECMRHQVKNTCRESANAARQKHVAQLAYGGVRENFLYVPLHQADGRRKERRRAANDGDDQHRRRRVRKKNVRARNDIYARGHHRRRMNQRAHRRRSFHRVWQPNVQRQLCRFSARAREKQQASDRERPKMSHRIRGPRVRLGEKRYEIQSPKRLKQQKHPQHESKVADAIDDERFLPRIRSGLLQEIKTDKQVTREAHSLPANEEQHVIRRQHQDQHEKHEQVEIGKEPAVTALMRHVSGRVNVNEPAHSGHHQHHHHRELVHLQVKARAEIARRDPGEECFLERMVILGEVIEKLAHRFKGREKR